MCENCKNIKMENVKCECKCERKTKVNYSYDVCLDCKHLIYLFDYFMMRID